MPKKTLQEETSDALTENTIELAKYSNSKRTETMDEVSQLLITIKATLLNGSEDVSLGELRNMMRTAKRMFREGYRVISKNTEEGIFELLEVELESQTKILQQLIDEYEIPYDVRQPSYVLAKRSLKDLPIEDLTFAEWETIWEKKLIGRMSSGLFSEYSDDKSRMDLVQDVFGKGKDPFTFQTFLRSNADLNGLLISGMSGTGSVAASSIANSNTGIIKGEQWNSCLCATTCISCSSLHGAIRYINGPDETDGNEIPLHPNCLCFWTYIYKNPKSMSVKVPKTVVSAINSNEVPKKFPLWYNSIQKQRKIELFGRTKVKMIESGEIKVSQLLTKKNRRVYTLQELAQKGYKIPNK